MSFLRRIGQNPNVSKAVPVAKAFIPFPLGRDPSSLPKIDLNCDIYNDCRPISLRYRVTAMLELSNLDKAAEFSHHAVFERYYVGRDTLFICNSVIGAMCNAKRYEEAISLFNYFFNESQKALPNTLSCNLIIKAHLDEGRLDHALELYSHIVLDGRLSPGMDTYVMLTKGLVDTKRLDEACVLVASIGRCYIMVYNVLIRGLLDAGKYVKASQIAEKLKGKLGKLPWTLVIHKGTGLHKAMELEKVLLMEYWLKQGNDEEAMEMLELLNVSEVMDTVVGNRVLQILLEHGKKRAAWGVFFDIGRICDPETYGIMIKSFSENSISLWRASGRCYRTVIACLCEQGKMSEAEELFAKMFDEEDEDYLMVGPDVSTFRAMTNGYVMVGRVDDAIKMLNKMKISNLRKLAVHRDP